MAFWKANPLIKRVKNLANTEDKKRLFSNFFSLSMLQAANYIFPLITLPYLVRVLGIENFGLLAFATAIITYFSIITDYGFNLTATREISIHRDNREKIIEIFSSVITIKVILMFISLILLTLLVFSFERLNKDWAVYFLTFGTVVGQVLFPVWFFQGMESMKYITYLNFLSKLIFTVAIFIFVQEQNDYHVVPFLISLGSLVAGIWSLYLIKKEFDIGFRLQSLMTIKYHLAEGWHIFTSSFGINLYKNNAILILGLFANELVVGYFAIAKKIIDMLNQIASIISITMFPYVNNKYRINKSFISFLVKIGSMIFAYTFLIFIILLFFSENISMLLSGKVYDELVISLKIMSIVPLIIAVNIPAVHILLVGKKDDYFAKSVLLGGLIDLVLLFVLIPLYGYIGAAISVLIVELFVTSLLYFYAIKLVRGKI